MSSIRLALAQHDFPVGAVEANAAAVRRLVDAAHGAGAQLVAFPELTLSGYPPEDLLLRPSFLTACNEQLQQLASASQDGPMLVLGHPQARGEQLYNAASVLRRGQIRSTYYKQALPNYTVFDEKRYFTPGEASCIIELEGVRMGLLICEDIWVPRPALQLAAQGAECLLVINASPYDQSQAARREVVLAERARESGLSIAYVNQVGGQDDLLFDGASLLIGRDGRIRARAPAFQEHLLLVEFDRADANWIAIDWPDASADSPDAVLYAGLVRGIRDYVDKNGFPGVLLGLSGGIDSALTLALAVDALGPERVMAVMLPTRFTSQLSHDGARRQAEAAGVAYHVLPIEGPFASVMEQLTPAFAGKPADTTEENLQSRIRGLMLMALSNKHGALLLSTGNKSEMAVGYATLYGDMCGAYAPLKDVYKTVVYQLARWRNRGGEIIPWEVIERPPSAELRENQTDQDSLPDYDQLDAILARFIEGQQSKAEIAAAGFDAELVFKVVRLVLANEFKRRQSAPGPRVTRCAFGRERRYPITSGWR
ncbi:NAD+ synthase [Frateuria aurantia]